MPTPEDQERSEYQQLRARMLDHTFDADVRDFAKEAHGKENAGLLGLPDTSLALLPSLTRQLSVPGLYGTQPTTHGPDGPATDAMLDPESGAVQQCGYWQLMQHVSYMANGMGVYGVRLHAQISQLTGEAEAALRCVPPHNVYVIPDPARPTQALFLSELLIRPYRRKGSDITEQGWFWDVFDFTNPQDPKYRILEAVSMVQGPEVFGADWTDFFEPELTEYPRGWRSPAGVPFIPLVWHRSVDTGEFWPTVRRGLHAGTLRSAVHWTFCSHAAVFAAGEHNLVGGVAEEAFPAEMQAAVLGPDGASQPGFMTMRIRPGTVTLLPTEQDKTLTVAPLRAGINLPELLGFAQAYATQQYIDNGVSPSDAQRKHANPTSGAALEINQSDKRAHAKAVEPLYRKTDTLALQYLGWMLTAVSGVQHQAAGLSVTYHTAPLTPGEQAEQRNQLEWEVEQGQRGPVDTHLVLHPGKTRDQALVDIVAARVETAQVDQLVQDELDELAAARGGQVDDNIQQQALNGAQVQALLMLVTSAAQGQVPRESAQSLIQAAFPTFTEDETQHILGTIGQGFQPAAPPAAPDEGNTPAEDLDGDDEMP